MSRDLTLLHPKLQAILQKVKAECEAQGLYVLFTDGLRTKAEQDALYAQGRTAAGTIVTNVRYPDSLHNWGVAVDFCRNVKGREYDDSDNFFYRVAYVAKRYGLDWGGDWTKFKDKPHLQMGEYSLDGTAAYMKATYGTPEKFMATWKKTPAGETSSVSSADTFPSGEGKKPQSGFYDVPDERWSAEAVEWAAKAGIAAGFEDGTFRPEEPITREQAVSLLYRYDAWRKTQQE